MAALRLILFSSVFVIASCRVDKYLTRWPETRAIDYRYEDRPQQKKIFVYFHNTSKKPICLGPGNWPENGILLNPGNEVSLEVDGQRYFLGPENDFCPRCRKKVSPGEKVQDFFEYKSFNLKGKSELSDKKLHFSPVGVSCR
jgi:hypothetical protein